MSNSNLEKSRMYNAALWVSFIGDEITLSRAAPATMDTGVGYWPLLSPPLRRLCFCFRMFVN